MEKCPCQRLGERLHNLNFPLAWQYTMCLQIKQLRIDVPAGTIQPNHQLLVRDAHSAVESVRISHHCCYNYSFGFYNMCLYLGVSSQHVARLYSGMLLLEMIPGVTRPSTDINNNNNCVLPSSACAAIYGVMPHVHISNTPSSTNVIVELDGLLQLASKQL